LCFKVNKQKKRLCLKSRNSIESSTQGLRNGYFAVSAKRFRLRVCHPDEAIVELALQATKAEACVRAPGKGLKK
jgi:hypothetical protein